MSDLAAFLAQRRAEINVQQRSFTKRQRQALADQGKAMPDDASGGKFPIENGQDLDNALRDYNRSGQDPAVRRHIIKRARALGLLKTLPDAWNVQQSAGGALLTDEGDLPVAEWVRVERDGTVYLAPLFAAPVAQEGSMAPAVCPTCGQATLGVGMTEPEMAGAKKKVTQAQDPPLAPVHAATHAASPGATCPQCGQMIPTDLTAGGGPPSGTPLGEGGERPLPGAAYDPKPEGASGGPGRAQQDQSDRALGVTPEGAGAGTQQPRAADGPLTREDDTFVLQSAAILQTDELKRVVTWVIQTPNEPVTPASMPDTELVYPPETIKQMAWDFLSKYRNGQVGVLHTEFEDGRVQLQGGRYATMVESYVAPVDITLPTGKQIAQGSWVGSFRFADDDLWAAVLQGLLPAISLASTDADFEDVPAS